MEVRWHPRWVNVSWVKAIMMLCDAVQVVEGKLYMLGGGWSVIGPDPTPFGIAMKLDVSWTELDAPHHWELFLVDEDGHEVVVETPDGPQPIEMRGDFQLPRPPELPDGSPVAVPFALNLPGLPLAMGKRFSWRLTIDGDSDPSWELTFMTRDTVPEMPGFPDGFPPPPQEGGPASS